VTSSNAPRKGFAVDGTRTWRAERSQAGAGKALVEQRTLAEASAVEGLLSVLFM